MNHAVRPGQHCRVTVDGVEREGYVRCALARDESLAVVHVDRLHAVVDPWLHAEWRWALTVGDDRHPDVAAAQPQHLDLLLIDTSHRRAHTLMELREYGTRVCQGGIIAMHDFDLPAVRRAVEQWDRPHQLMVMPADHELALLAVD